MTNYERIKNMSIDEMTAFLESMTLVGCCTAGEYLDCRNCPLAIGTVCCNDLKKYLEQEVDNDEL